MPLYPKRLTVPQGTGRIFFRFSSENLHLWRRATSPCFAALSILAQLFSARQRIVAKLTTKKGNLCVLQLTRHIVRAEPPVRSSIDSTYFMYRYVNHGD